MASQSASMAGAIPAKDSNNANSAQGSTPCLGKRKREEADVAYHVLRHWEVDENDVIRGVHVNPHNPDHYRLGGHFPEPRLEPSSHSNSGSTQHPVRWRGHSEVAMEVGVCKNVLVLHDLLEPSNTNLMVLDKDDAIIQCRPEQGSEMIGKVLEIWGTDKTMYMSMGYVSGRQGLEIRHKERKGGLVDGNYQYIPMDWAEADKLLSKVLPGEDGRTLVVIQLRPEDRSPPGNLKPGRRLVPIDDNSSYPTITFS
ncbi:hypothetical protein F5Y06DRAFT_303681 [Hypoxylon sp. FL0890]|nr:hypothetical protein F5Y06DRAFT_303681 [Hypoxylon sp. FL0890]